MLLTLGYFSLNLCASDPGVLLTKPLCSDSGVLLVEPMCPDPSVLLTKPLFSDTWVLLTEHLGHFSMNLCVLTLESLLLNLCALTLEYFSLTLELNSLMLSLYSPLQVESRTQFLRLSVLPGTRMWNRKYRSVPDGHLFESHWQLKQYIPIFTSRFQVSLGDWETFHMNCESKLIKTWLLGNWSDEMKVSGK